MIFLPITEQKEEVVKEEETIQQKEEEIVKEEENKKRKNETEGEEKNKRKKVPRGDLPKKHALLISYVGTNFSGLQLNPDSNTIEKDLLNTLFSLKAVKSKNTKNKREMPWHRACRTDKGVHAARNIITANLLPQEVRKEDFIKKMNDKLHKDIRLVAVQRVTDGFNPKLHCRRRTYLYLLPCNVLLPNKTDFDKDDLIRLNSLLKQFEGSHLFHNYTIKLSPSEDESRRHMITVSAGEPFEMKERRYVAVTFYGSSFLYNQIRKMIGIVIGIMRGMAEESLLKDSLGDKLFVKIPVAPGHTLLLDRPEFSGYDNKIEGDKTFKPLLWEEFNTQIEEYKRNIIFEEIARIEEKKEFANWLFQLVNEKRHNWFSKKEWIDDVLKRKPKKETKIVDGMESDNPGDE